MQLVCPHCQNSVAIAEADYAREIICPSCGSSFRLEKVSTESWDMVAGEKIGKFELLEILGQGGFGTVYKARDAELDRTVALKVPRAGHLAGPQEVDRFLREARSIAQIRHAGIVAVHDIGQHNGMPYLVNDFIEGVTLADFLTSRRPSFTESAELIAQVADALQFVHEHGVVHRDVKPSNIMLETGRVVSDGVVSVGTSHYSPKLMDFGLAKRDAGEVTMTHEGQVLGTPAYMSPEQARGESHQVDGRTDVYSLGVILYQLLTGELPFRGNPRMMLHQVLHEEPRPPRKLNDRVPRDLETICLKALAKEPARRYPSAAGLADDLRRWLKNEPILARPVGKLERARRWCRRNPAWASFWAAVFLLSAGTFASVVYYLENRAERALEQGRQEARKQASERDIAAALEEAANRRQQLDQKLADPVKVSELLSDIDSWHTELERARAAWKRADELAAANRDLLDPELADRVLALDNLLKRDEENWRLAKELDDIRLEASTTVEGKFDYSKAAPKYAKLFAKLGLDMTRDEPAQVAARLTQLPLRFVLVAALDHWAVITRDNKALPRILETARRADPHPWRDQVRDLKNWQDEMVLERLARKVDVSQHSPQVLTLLAMLHKKEEEAAPLLRKALGQYPRDFWLHFTLGNKLRDIGEKVGCFRAALAVRPNTYGTHINLGAALQDTKDLDGAIFHFKKAIEVDPKFAMAYSNLGNALSDRKDLDGAIVQCKKAIDLDPKLAAAYLNLGNALRLKKDLDGAVFQFKRAIELEPKYAKAYNGLGNALHDKKDLEAAIFQYKKAIELDPKYALAYVNLGVVHHHKKDLDGAIVQYKKAIELDPKYALAYGNLGIALHHKKDLDGAIVQLKKAIDLDPTYAVAYGNLGIALHHKKDLDGAIVQFNKAIDLDPKNAVAYDNLGMALHHKNDLDGAIVQFNKAIDLDPKNAAPYNNLGTALHGNKDLDGAILQFKNAIELDPKYAAAFDNLGMTLYKKKDLDGAIVYFKKTILLDPKNVLAYNHLGVALYDKNDLDGAIVQFKKAIDLDPTNAAPYNNLGNIFRRKNDLDGAIGQFKKAIDLDPRNAAPYNNLGTALHGKKDLDGAILQYKKAIELNSNYAEAHCHLGSICREIGDFQEALHFLKRGHALGSRQPGWPYPSAQWVKQCEHLLALDQKLTVVLQGMIQPRNAAESMELASLCQRYKKQFAAAASFYEAAFSAAPALAEDLPKQHRYHAAFCAALAAAGKGHDAEKLNDKERAKLRQKAFDWLQADLGLHAKAIHGNGNDKTTSKLREEEVVLAAVQNLAHWQRDPDLAGVREEKELAKLPRVEIEAWQKLWRQTADLLQQARARFTETTLKGTLAVKQPEQIHEVKMQAGRVYVIDLESPQFDTFLRLEDSQGKVLAENDDISPGNLNSRLIFTAPRAAAYRIVATSFEQRGQGSYVLTIREFTPKKK